MGVEFSDTFTEASDTVLESHTPDTGTGWSSNTGNIIVDSAGDYAHDNNNSAGSRYNTDDQMSSADMDVIGDFSYISGTSIFWGPRARAATSTGGADHEFTYDQGLGAFALEADSSTEAWPGNPTELKLECRGSALRGLADDVEKVSATESSSNLHAGLLLGNFDGGSLDLCRCDNFQVVIPAGVDPIAQIIQIPGTVDVVPSRDFVVRL